MNQQWIIVYLLVICGHLSHQKSTPNATTYIAAVVEYPPKYLTNISETLRINSDAYVRLIKEAHLRDVDIIVFPEDALTSVYFPERENMENWTTIIPNASHNYTPCNQDTIKVNEAVRKISCAAKDNEIYVVINVSEKVCHNAYCLKDKILYYNTNVVFDRTGKIIAKYRKTHLYTEPEFNVTAKPEIVTFDTDFGVKFGTFICFDIYFPDPALQLTRDHNVTDIIYTTTWFSESPFITAAQLQAGWSFAEDVNLLAAGYNRPAFSNGGSGIYLGRKGIGITVMPKTTSEEILIYQVPKIKKKIKYNKNYHDPSKDQSQKVWSSYYEEVIHYEWKKQENNTMIDNDTLFLHQEDMDAFETLSLEENITKTVCQNNFCCDFKIKLAKIDPSTKYRLVVFNGIRSIWNIPVDDNVGIRTCGIIQCLNDSISSCGSIRESETVFSNIEIMTTFHDYKNSLIMPSTLNTDILPLKNWIFNDHIDNDHVHVNMLLNNRTNNLVTFGIHSRYFHKNANTSSFHSVIS